MSEKICRDVTFTIVISETPKERYDKIMKMLDDNSDVMTGVDTYTYMPENLNNEDFESPY